LPLVSDLVVIWLGLPRVAGVAGVAAAIAVFTGVARGVGVAVAITVAPVAAGAPAVVALVLAHSAVVAGRVAGFLTLVLVAVSHLGAMEGGEPKTQEERRT